MKRYLALMLVLGLFSITLTACKANKVRITEGHNGQVLTLNQGDLLSLSIEGNTSTGYIWEIEEVDSSVLALKGEPDYRSSSRLTGAGGTYTFTFEAAAPGNTTLRLKYYRSFENDVPPIKTFTVTVTVE